MARTNHQLSYYHIDLVPRIFSSLLKIDCCQTIRDLNTSLQFFTRVNISLSLFHFNLLNAFRLQYVLEIKMPILTRPSPYLRTTPYCLEYSKRIRKCGQLEQVIWQRIHSCFLYPQECLIYFWSRQRNAKIWRPSSRWIYS